MPLPLAGAKIKASDLAAIFPVGVDGYSNFTPTLTQGATPTKTVTLGIYNKVGRRVNGHVFVTLTSNGTAANVVLVGLPVASAAPPACPIGYGFIYDATGGLYKGVLLQAATNVTAEFVATHTITTGRLGADTFTAALASPDQVGYYFDYPATS